MNLKTECKQLIELLTAIENGGTLQTDIFREGDWRDAPSQDIQFGHSMKCYRIKPAPKFRAWEADEVPLGAVFKGKTTSIVLWPVMLDAAYGQIRLVTSTVAFGYSMNELAEGYLHSLDHGKTWLPCGISE